MPTQQEHAAAREFYGLIIQKLTNEKGVHAETAIAAAGRMAGTLLLRSLQLPLETLEPGTPVFSDAANEKGPALVGTLGEALSQMNVPFDPQKLEASAANQGNAPLLSVVATQELVEKEMHQIRQKYQLSNEAAAHAAAITTAFMVQKCAQLVDPHIGFKIAAYSFVEGAKTVPQRLAISTNEESKKPWYKIW